MKSRQEIKANAREAMTGQYGTAILIPFLTVLISLAGSLFEIIPLIGSIMVFATSIFIDIPLGVNAEGLFIKIYNREKASASEMFSNLAVNYWRKIGGMVFMMLALILWASPLMVSVVIVVMYDLPLLVSILLILMFSIPMVYKSLSYSMTTYILADRPDVMAAEALKLSVRMTKGHEWKLFVLGLSFIGWGLLSVLTLGILFLLYVAPYMSATYAGFYVELRDQVMRHEEADDE